MNNPLFWEIIALLGVVLLLVIAVLLALNLTRKRSTSMPEQSDSPEEIEDDGSATTEAWNYLVDIDTDFLGLEDPDDGLVDKNYVEYADLLRAYASEVSTLAAQIEGTAQIDVDPKLLDWAARMRDWYCQWSDLYHEWATHFGNMAQFERDHTGIWPMIEGAWRGATQLDIFGRGNEVSEAQNQILAVRDGLEKQTAKLVGKRQLLMAERGTLGEKFKVQWGWEDIEITEADEQTAEPLVDSGATFVHDLHNGICRKCGCSEGYINSYHPSCRSVGNVKIGEPDKDPKE